MFPFASTQAFKRFFCTRQKRFSAFSKKIVQTSSKWTSAQIDKLEWPPNSPDLNPLDYAIWSILEEKACAKLHPTVESLKRALIKAWDEITIEMLEKIDNFPKRLKAYVEAKGGHFE
uniref:Transposase n=1 Tax=Acrobeloides nanus TaxID=290746 RepID=A0A914DLV0_9BILA